MTGPSAHSELLLTRRADLRVLDAVVGSVAFSAFEQRMGGVVIVVVPCLGRQTSLDGSVVVMRDRKSRWEKSRKSEKNGERA